MLKDYYNELKNKANSMIEDEVWYENQDLIEAQDNADEIFEFSEDEYQEQHGKHVIALYRDLLISMIISLCAVFLKKYINMPEPTYHIFASAMTVVFICIFIITFRLFRANNKKKMFEEELIILHGNKIVYKEISKMSPKSLVIFINVITDVTSAEADDKYIYIHGNVERCRYIYDSRKAEKINLKTDVIAIPLCFTNKEKFLDIIDDMIEKNK